MNRYLVSLLALTMLLVAACGAPAITPQTPPEIVYGEDVCDHCGMIINEERFAAGAVVQSGADQFEHRRFDDIGDMFAFAQELADSEMNTQSGATTPTIVTYFVHDYQSLEWLDGRNAYFVLADTILTPMGSGLVAFGSREEAEAQAQIWDATVLDFEMAQSKIVMSHSHTQH